MNRPRQRTPRLTALLAVLLAAGCGAGPAPSTVPKPFAGLGIAHSSSPMPGIHCSGQPSTDQFDGLPAAGIDRVICLRPPGEEGTGWEEERAKALGLRFVRLPIQGAQDLTEANVRALDEALASSSDGTLLCCASSNRVGALMALRARQLQGKSPEEALAIGKACGLTKLEPQVKGLVHR
ncbi:MAG: hypothetical protein HZB39_11010 [Planctomycetes bacterium]|nr:hypothetical protein [Planctomycetota bacterium]